MCTSEVPTWGQKMEYRSGSTRRIAGEATGALARRGSHARERAVALALRAAGRPYISTLTLFAANLLAIGLMIGTGELLYADPSELFRELMPGTWLSVAQLAFIAATAWAIHRQVLPRSRLRFDNLWGVSVVVFAAFAVDEATQLTIFAADALRSVGALTAPAGFKDLDAFLLTVLLVAGGAALMRYGWTLLSHPAAVAVMAVGVALGAGSQLLDSTLTSTSAEFVAEESLKLAAEPFLVGGYLVVLHQVIRRRTAPRARSGA